MASVFCPVPTGHVPLVWDRIETMIAEATARGERRTAETVYDALCSGESQLWMAWNDGPEAVAITEIHQFPLKKLIRITLMTGRDRANWLPFLEGIEDWARAQGCTVAEPIARPGWERVLAPLGYRKSHVVLEKPL